MTIQEVKSRFDYLFDHEREDFIPDEQFEDAVNVAQESILRLLANPLSVNPETQKSGNARTRMAEQALLSFSATLGNSTQDGIYELSDDIMHIQDVRFKFAGDEVFTTCSYRKRDEISKHRQMSFYAPDRCNPSWIYSSDSKKIIVEPSSVGVFNVDVILYPKKVSIANNVHPQLPDTFKDRLVYGAVRHAAESVGRTELMGRMDQNILQLGY